MAAMQAPFAGDDADRTGAAPMSASKAAASSIHYGVRIYNAEGVIVHGCRFFHGSGAQYMIYMGREPPSLAPRGERRDLQQHIRRSTTRSFSTDRCHNCRLSAMDSTSVMTARFSSSGALTCQDCAWAEYLQVDAAYGSVTSLVPRCMLTDSAWRQLIDCSGVPGADAARRELPGSVDWGPE